MAYQRACFKVLYDYWHNNSGSAAKQVNERIRLHQLRIKLINDLQKSRCAISRQAIYEGLVSE